MRVAQELLTVFVDSDTREVCIVLAGLRVKLTHDETASLTRTLLSGLERLTAESAAYGGANEVTDIGRLSADVAQEEPNSISGDDPRNSPVPLMTGQNEERHDKMRALIKARIKDKGLSIWGECRS
ncbi:MAG: hypothetical protein ACLQJR_20690 [Stellaceae bacterium]